jgi:hypothetical protein
LHSSELLIVCGSRLFFDLCTTSPRLSKEDTAYFELEISAEIDRQQTLFDPKVFRAAFPALGVNFDFVRNLLTFSQAREPRAFKGADVNKHIGSAIIWLDKAKTFLDVEPLDGTCGHFSSPKHLARPSRDCIQLVDVFGKEPAGAFKKAQRLIERMEAMLFRNRIQG